MPTNRDVRIDICLEPIENQNFLGVQPVLLVPPSDFGGLDPVCAIYTQDLCLAAQVRQAGPEDSAFVLCGAPTTLSATSIQAKLGTIELQQLRPWLKVELTPVDEHHENRLRQLPPIPAVLSQQLCGVVLCSGMPLSVFGRDGFVIECRCQCFGPESQQPAVWGVVAADHTQLHLVDPAQLQSSIVRELPTCATPGALIKECAAYAGYLVQSALSGCREGPRTILLEGSSGLGKTSCAMSAAAAAGAMALSIPIEAMCGAGGRDALRSCFDSARNQEQPVMVIIEDLEAYFPGSGGVEDQYSQLLRNEFAQAAAALPGGQVCVVGTTGAPHLVHSGVKDCFAHRIQFEVPSPSERLSMFSAISESRGESLDSEQLHAVNSASHGFAESDLAAVLLDTAQLQSVAGGSWFEHLLVSAERHVPQALGQPVRCKVPWAAVGGLTSVKKALRDALVAPHARAAAFATLGIRGATGVLLHGPPGTGKTLLAKAVATDASANFISVDIAGATRSAVGESERHLQNIFRVARASSPCVVFFDEVDALFAHSEESGGNTTMIGQLLHEMDNLRTDGNGVMLLAATNNLSAIHGSLLRPGRLEVQLFVPPPDFEGRVQVMKALQHSGVQLADNVDVEGLMRSPAADGCTGADLAFLCRRAALLAVQEDPSVNAVSQCQLESALDAMSQARVR